MVVDANDAANQMESGGQDDYDVCVNHWEFPNSFSIFLVSFGTASHFQLDWKSICAPEQAQDKPLKKKQDKIFGVQINPDYDIAHGKEASEGSSKPMRD